MDLVEFVLAWKQGEQREHFEALAKLLPTDHEPKEKGFFDKVLDFFD